MEFSDLELERLKKLQRLRDRGIDPYPARVERTHTNRQVIDAFNAAEPTGEAVNATVVGRVVLVRPMGKASFAHIEDGTSRLQIYMKKEEVGEAAYEMFLKDLDLGDFVQASGHMFRTKTGEPTLRLSDLRLISKSITPPPEKWHGLKDVETRLRQRYADLMSNPETRDVFRTRTKVVNAVRRFFDELDFIEVETPVLQPLYGGAAARPFITHHNQLNQDLYLRISFELYLKRLLVGMYERVYEIGRDFRNEGVSFKHNPEFTQLEFYAAYWDYNKVMEVTEQLLAYVAQAVTGSTKIQYGEYEIELGGKWQRLTMREAIKKWSGIDYADYPEADQLRAAIRAKGGNAPEDASWGKLIDGLVGDYVEPELIQPTFIYDYPRDISPLAKRKADDPMHVERFEFFIAGMEMGNAFSELNDPLDQEERFVEMAKADNMEEGEAHPLDEDYLRAMRYGMPPNGGFGMGIDRLTMLMTNRTTIREVILYPHLRTTEK
ncbi:MAG: lysine--tRNA ligase [Anaerolineae bacterium]